MHATITLIEIERYGIGDGGPREGTEEWPEMSRRGSGVRVTESLWGGYVEEYLSCGREGGRWERCRVSRQMGARWTVTATSEGVRGIGFACWDRTRVRIRRTNRGLQDPLSSLPTPEQTKRVQNHDACFLPAAVAFALASGSSPVPAIASK